MRFPTCMLSLMVVGIADVSATLLREPNRTASLSCRPVLASRRPFTPSTPSGSLRAAVSVRLATAAALALLAVAAEARGSKSRRSTSATVALRWYRGGWSGGGGFGVGLGVWGSGLSWVARAG